VREVQKLARLVVLEQWFWVSLVRAAETKSIPGYQKLLHFFGDDAHMNRLLPITSGTNIPTEYRDTAVGRLLEYHNLGRPYETFSTAQLLVGMCMDNRKHLHIPDNFAFIIRSGGANLRYSEFKVSYAIAVGGVRSIALIGHTQCGMVNLLSRKQQFVQGLVEGAGWSLESAEEHFLHFAPMFEIGNEMDFILSEVKRLRLRYPNILVAPMLYRVEDNQLYLIEADAGSGG
jgi:carbonic anhydrase